MPIKVQLKKLPHSEVELTITVTYDEYQKAEKQAILQLSQQLKMPGFRHGHIPEDIVRREIGEQGLNSAALELLLPQTYAQAVKEQKTDVIAPPKVNIKTSIKKAGDELVYVAQVAVMPEVKVGNYKKIKVKRLHPKVTPQQVKETIEIILERFGEWKEVAREARAKDRAELDFEAFDPSSGQPVPNTASKNHPLVLGSKVMVPGFEDAILGMKAGETKEFTLTFPPAYHTKALQGKTVKFKAVLKRLEELVTQELTDALVERITGQKQGVDEFKKQVEADLQAEIDLRSQGEHDARAVDEVIKITEVDLPQALIDEEIKYMLEEKKRQVINQGLTWDQYLEHLKKTDADFARDHQKPAEERLRARFGVQHIIRDAKIEATDAETEAKINEILSSYPAQEQEKARGRYKKDSAEWRNLKNNLAADKLIEMLSE